MCAKVSSTKNTKVVDNLRAMCYAVGMEGVSMQGSMNVRRMAYVAMCVVLMAICSWITIPATVPFTLQTFAVFTTCALLGGRLGLYSVCVYILLGAVGLPVFSGFGAGSELVQVSLMETLASRMGITANGFIAKLFLDQTPMVYLAYLLVVFTVIYFNRTKSGLNYKAVGEYPKAAATLGIDVIGIKYTASVICGALAGIGGAYLTTCYTTTYVDGNIAGRGFIALAAVIFGRWNAGGVLIACLFFGFCDALQIRLQVGSYNIPYQFFQMIPYIATVVVLAAIGMKKAGPKSCGKPYRKEER